MSSFFRKKAIKAHNHRHNRFGERLREGDEPQVASSSYLGDDNRPLWLKDGNNGFDMSIPPKLTYLKKGTRIIRYGDEIGYYAAPLNSPFATLSLPYTIRSCEYNEYEVVEDEVVPAFAIDVLKGIVAVQPAWPHERGGGIQYFFPHRDQRKSVLYYVGRGLKRLEVSEWSPLMEEDKNHI